MKLAVIPGDGIGPEVVAEGLKVLTGVVPDIEISTYDLGASRWHRTGELLPDSVLRELKQVDAILLGAVGDPTVPAGILERGLLLRLRFELDHHVNLRPARLYPGVAGPLAGDQAIDLVVVREGTEGPYVGNGGLLRKDTPHEIATEVSINSYFGVERVVRDAFGRASRRARKHLTLVHKTNVLTYSGQLWSQGRRRGVDGVPGHHRRLLPHRRGDDLPGDRPGPVRRDRDRQPVRRHPHRPRRGRLRRHRPGRLRQPGRLADQPVDVRARARVRARTSPATAPPIRPPRCCRWPCCWTTSACPTRRAGSRPRWRSTSPPGSPVPPAGPAPSATGWPRWPPADRRDRRATGGPTTPRRARLSRTAS